MVYCVCNAYTPPTSFQWCVCLSVTRSIYSFIISFLTPPLFSASFILSLTITLPFLSPPFSPLTSLLLPLSFFFPPLSLLSSPLLHLSPLTSPLLLPSLSLPCPLLPPSLSPFSSLLSLLPHLPSPPLSFPPPLSSLSQDSKLPQQSDGESDKGGIFLTLVIRKDGIVNLDYHNLTAETPAVAATFKKAVNSITSNMLLAHASPSVYFRKQ